MAIEKPKKSNFIIKNTHTFIQYTFIQFNF